MYKTYFIIAAFLFTLQLKANEITFRAHYLIDSSKTMSFSDILTSDFEEKSNLNFGFIKGDVWIKIELTSEFISPLYLQSGSTLIDSITCYSSLHKKQEVITDLNFFNKRRLLDPIPIFKINQVINNKFIILKISGKKPISLSLQLLNERENNQNSTKRVVFFGVFTGIMSVMFLYNLFLFFSLKVKLYLLYCLYILSVFLAQITFLGYSYMFIWPNLPWINTVALFILPAGVVIMGITFISVFLKLNEINPKASLIFQVIMALTGLSIIISLTTSKNIGYSMSQLLAMISALLILVYAAVMVKNKHKEARYILLGWSLFFAGVIIYVLKDFGLIPTSFWTNYSMPIGAAVETIILSLALADSINTLKKEKESANNRVFQEVMRNEELVKNQNIMLERKVMERTQELQTALDELKEAQSQLVQSEKMASLGVLTAGIAHEINNPINFVTANIIPLRDNIAALTQVVQAYKTCDKNNLEHELIRLQNLEDELELEYLLTETSQLIDGIEEGAKRTHTIVDGLNTFSRGDAGKKGYADVNDGIKSTVSVLKSRLNRVKVKLDLQKDLPQINCQIGKINQVVLNLINNSIDALEEKNGPNSALSILQITSLFDGNFIKVRIKDNANGISDEIKDKIMEPFYTTKAVGKGTGLGLSISYSIIEEHGGQITMESEVGVGSTFTISLPLG
jgi:two-component system NtrC family sensor kinase